MGDANECSLNLTLVLLVLLHAVFSKRPSYLHVLFFEEVRRGSSSE